jgi:hypothetical protein
MCRGDSAEAPYDYVASSRAAPMKFECLNPIDGNPALGEGAILIVEGGGIGVKRTDKELQIDEFPCFWLGKCGKIAHTFLIRVTSNPSRGFSNPGFFLLSFYLPFKVVSDSSLLLSYCARKNVAAYPRICVRQYAL